MTVTNFSGCGHQRAPRLTVFASCFKDACEVLMGTILKELQKKNPVSPEQASLNEDLHQPSAPRDSGLRAGLIITGKTLEFALQESLQRQFLELTACCQAVVCCRATPLQKSEVVKLVRNHLRVMTLAIGEWGWNLALCFSLSCQPRLILLSVLPSVDLFTFLADCAFPPLFLPSFFPFPHSFPLSLHHLFDHLLL